MKSTGADEGEEAEGDEAEEEEAETSGPVKENKRSRKVLAKSTLMMNTERLIEICERDARACLSKKAKRKLKTQKRLEEKAKLFVPTTNTTSAGVKYTTTTTGGFILTKPKKGSHPQLCILITYLSH